jgi:Prp8 binding protein
VQYALPGHTGVVTAVAYSPREPVLATASTDKSLFLGELAA